MATLFVTHPGQVVALPGTIGILPLTIFLDNWPGFPAIRAIITNLTVQKAGNQQFLHTLQEYIYVYVFGERIGDMTIGGLIFSEACVLPGNAPSGFEQLMHYYDQYRLSRTGSTITVQVGTSGLAVFRGFLIGVRADITDPQHQLGQFALYLKILTPEALRA
jgi:hypothetical protein